MKSKNAWLAVLLILPLPLAAQAPSIITMAEPITIWRFTTIM